MSITNNIDIFVMAIFTNHSRTVTLTTILTATVIVSSSSCLHRGPLYLH